MATRILSLSAVFVMTLLLTACGGGGSDSIVGKWGLNVEKALEEVPEDQRAMAEGMITAMAESMVFEFKSDGTVTVMGETATYEINGNKITMSKDGEDDMTGTWSISGDNLTLTPDGEDEETMHLVRK